MLKTVVCALAVLAIAMAVPAFAQETTAGGNLQNQMSWTALSNKVDGVGGRVKLVEADVAQLLKCNAKKWVYAPADTSPSKDKDGCVPISPVASLTTKVMPASMCVDYRNGVKGDADDYNVVQGVGVFKKRVSCPTGWKLLACSGGPGDTSEAAEGSYIRPIANNTCELVMGQPICTASMYWTKAWVFAHCAKE